MKLRTFAIVVVGLVIVAVVGSIVAGSLLMSPAHQAVGDLPPDLAGHSVTFQSRSGVTIHGWFVPGVKGNGAIALMHGVRSNRLSVLERARFLNRAGFSILLFDFQAHGESAGKRISFGYLESKDAIAAASFLRQQVPDEKIGIIGISMGGAATLLAEPPIQADALILEMVYPTIDEAVANRLAMRLGRWSKILTPLLTLQLRPQLGIWSNQLRPIDHLGTQTPKLFIAGAEDRHTTIQESQKMFDLAGGPKELWIVKGAAHVDLHEANKVEYEQRVVNFFKTYLR